MKNKLCKIKKDNHINFIEQSKIILLDNIFNITSEILLEENIIIEEKKEVDETIIKEEKKEIVEIEVYETYSDYYTSDEEYNNPTKNKQNELKTNVINKPITTQIQQKHIMNNMNIIKRSKRK